MKRLFLLSFLLILSYSGYCSGLPEGVSYGDVLKFEVRDGNSDFTPLRSFVKKHSDDIKGGKAPVYVTGYTDTSGNNPASGMNMVDATVTALKTYGLSDNNIVIERLTGSYGADQPLVVVNIGIPAGIDGVSVVSSVLVSGEPVPTVISTGDLSASSKTSGVTGLSLRTNLLFLLGTTLNAGVEWRFSGGSSILINGGFARWQWDNGMRRYHTWYLFPEYRRYLGSLGRWYVGIQGQYGELDVMLSTRGYNGEFYGGSVTGGYNLPIGRKLSLDFNLGLGYTTFRHDKYEWQTEPGSDRNVRVRTAKDRRRNLIGPNQLGINLVWHLSR